MLNLKKLYFEINSYDHSSFFTRMCMRMARRVQGKIGAEIFQAVFFAIRRPFNIKKFLDQIFNIGDMLCVLCDCNKLYLDPAWQLPEPNRSTPIVPKRLNQGARVCERGQPLALGACGKGRRGQRVPRVRQHHHHPG